ncbi:hypothetical protein [Blattabacterium cuenoti]|uniref:hypothetical protein n=1 Tax=Blattabacterium cuenoti TaxID=1653831 RepID=UPI00163BF139|nr:hypothetical protein [Blattabacterium cuenoti]
MNTSIIRFLVTSIFLSLGVFIISCNDEEHEITSSAEDYGFNNIDPSNPDLTFYNTHPPSTITTTYFPPPAPHTHNDNNNSTPKIPANINPGELSQKIKDIALKIEILEKENDFHQNEYEKMVMIQKKIVKEVKRRRIVFRSKPYNSPEQFKAQKELEDQKKLGKEKLKILREKNLFLNSLITSITEAKNEELALKRMQENFQKQNQLNNNNNDQKTNN